MFADRAEAGRKLADELERMAPEDPVVLALPRGGVPVAAPIAERLGAPLDLLMVRKIGVPGHEELAAGAIAEGAEPVFNPDVLRSIRSRAEDFAEAVAAKRAEIAERRRMYLGGREQVALEGKTAIVVDDGIATGATMRAALGAARAAGAARVILAVPVAPADALAEVSPMVDETVCLQVPRPFYAVGAHYRDFRQVSDDEVAATLRPGSD
ncbi:Putative phosphoribosyl transferase [Defluviimonas aquaemixtae]|uniref:Phosphoribosyl transferase n=1 Tax=Albidovulum aquaemixtae TaxID=1542388 RepID=A0A2R8BLT0_9RHOB|nr:phosphoribosyltransferase family protein [Defluviimonas aquaemixtae]SPH24355.1 Putative phosphoribosyl transferase [Defluviimonas aquaemixtae]